MLKKGNIEDILKSVRAVWPMASERDIAFCILSDAIEEENVAYRMAYGSSYRKNVSVTAKQAEGLKTLRNALKPFGIGRVDDGMVSREQNKAELMQLLTKIKSAAKNGDIDMRDALKMEADIRVKLNDKFDMEEEGSNKRIIIVPQKHDLICPHTNKECSQMPTREACIKYYDLNVKEENHE